MPGDMIGSRRELRPELLKSSWIFFTGIQGVCGIWRARALEKFFFCGLENLWILYRMKKVNYANIPEPYWDPSNF